VDSSAQNDSSRGQHHLHGLNDANVLNHIARRPLSTFRILSGKHWTRETLRTPPTCARGRSL
jgi:hypothetical protein